MPDQRPRQDSSRNLLEELEDGWASNRNVEAAAKAEAEAAGEETETETEAERSSTPNVNDLDEGWLDQLFPEDEEEEPEEEEPELPDEKLDPVAFAAAKKAQAERLAARKERKK